MKAKTIAVTAAVAALAAAAGWLVLARGPLAPVSVQTAEVKRAQLKHSVFGVGTVEARYSYAIGPTQAGRVLSVHADHGDVVKAGQLLAEIDPVDLDARMASAASVLARARSGVQVAEAQQREAAGRHAMAAANAARYADLVQRNFVSREAAEIRTNEANVTRAALEAAQASLQAAHRDVERAQQERNALGRQRLNLRLVSPVDGVVVSREAEAGTTVVAGQAVVRVIDPASVWVRARIDQARATNIYPGLRADIALRSRRDAVMPGRVARVEIQNDAVTEERIVAVTFSVAAPISIGELAEVTIHRETAAMSLAVPSAAIQRVNQSVGVWQLVEGRARFRAVTTGTQTLDGMTELIEGLAAGERVIVYSSARLREGIRARAGRAP